MRSPAVSRFLRVRAFARLTIALGFLLAACGSKSNAAFYGTVVRLESGAPIAKATVTYTLDGTTKTTLSDSSGTFTVSVPPEKLPRDLDLVVTAPGGFTEVRRTVRLEPGTSSDIGKFAVEKLKAPQPAR